MATPPTTADRLVGGRTVAAAVGAWAGVIAVSRLWGVELLRRRPEVSVTAIPLMGSWELRLGPGLVVSVALAVAAAAAAPGLARRLSWPALLVAVTLAGATWATALALGDGPDALTRPLTTRWEYLQAVPEVGDAPGRYLDGYVERLGDAPLHVKAHPPGMVLVLWGLDRLGLGGPGWAAALLIGAGASAGTAAAVALRELAGEGAARAAVPFLAFSPAAVWLATSGDALFAGVVAWAIALSVVATGRAGRGGDLAALGAGVMAGTALHLTYGAVPMLFAVPIVAAARRRPRPLAVAGGGAAVVTAAFAVAGFWWPDGLDATRRFYAEGVAMWRPWSYFVVGNLGALALAVGPAAAVGLASLRDRGAGLIVGAAVLGVAAADLSGLSKGEVERIWLPFVPWLLAATAAPLPGGEGGRRWWLVAQLALGVGLQAWLRSPW